MRNHIQLILINLGVLGLTTLLSINTSTASSPSNNDVICYANPDDPGPPPYYAIDLVTTRRVPGTGRAVGTGHMTYVKTPFSVAVSSKGNYRYNIDIAIERMKAPRRGVYVAWITTPNLDQIKRLGMLDEEMRIKGQVDWNKFLVVITLEPSEDDLKDTWEGPVVLRGVSRSGLMHTMAGHGPFEREPCAQYGYR